jgi:transcriptional regulator with PAS, ATPase and Fis domain
MNLLNEIREDIEKYAETIAQVINIDVEIMSGEFIRITGTGRLKEKVNQDMSKESHVYRHVLKTGRTEIIFRPREEEICDTCPGKSTCTEILEVSTPILFNSAPIGVIGLICFDEKQKKEFIAKKDSYVKFLQQIALFIGAKLYEAKEKIMIENNNKVLMQVVDRIPDSVIITNEKETIELINEKGVGLFHLTDYNRKLAISSVKDFLDKKEFTISYGDTVHNVVGDIMDFPKNMGRFRTLYIFQEAEKWKTYLQQLNYNFSREFVFDSPEMKAVYSQIAKVAKNDSTVLITGDSGTGKEVAAKIVHMTSHRKNEPFVAVNCGAIPESLIESEFFGYVRGAFTGANPKGKIGFFEQADKGTIFLDEIGDMPYSLQIKLLRVIQEKTITPIGSDSTKDVDVRIIAATNKNLEDLVKEGRFREDLYYRLHVFPIAIPPLCDRPRDIENLTNFFLARYSGMFNIPLRKLSNEVLELFLNYKWPGNIRELKNIVEYIINVLEDRDLEITIKHLPPRMTEDSMEKEIKTLAEAEKDAIETLLKKYGYSAKDKEKIAKQLGIGLATLYRKLKLYNLALR